MSSETTPRATVQKIGMATEDYAKKYKGVGSFRRRLLTLAIPAIFLPIVIIGVTEEIISAKQSTAIGHKNIYNNSYLATNGFIKFLQDTKKINKIILATPSITQGLREANQKTLRENLPLVPIAELEKKYQDHKQIVPNATINNHLKYLVSQGDLSEILITERNGLNVGYSSVIPDLVQRDESWWRAALVNKYSVEESQFSESSNTEVMTVAQEIKDPDTGVFLGIVKTAIPTEIIKHNIESYYTDSLLKTEKIEIFDAKTKSTMVSINTDKSKTSAAPTANETISSLAQTVVNSMNTNRTLDDLRLTLNSQHKISHLKLETKKILSQPTTFVQFRYQNKIYNLSTIPNTQSIAISAVDRAEIFQAQKESIQRITLTTIILSSVSIIAVILLAQKITQPLNNLSKTTQAAAEGNLDIQVDLEGTLETHILADNFNNLIEQIKKSLQTQAQVAKEQTEAKEKLEMAIYELLEEVSDATDGDLTVRANLNSMELSTVADLFNAIITNLQDIAIEAKQSTSQVGLSLKQNEEEIRLLAEQAIAESKEADETLLSVQQMSQSIKTVAANASQAEKITDDTYNTIVTSTQNMNSTVNSILELRTTVGETAKKMKRLGESSLKISQVVSFIEEIALKTNVLAINASVEAGRAGEYGQGFTIVAEQVGALAEQSAAATKEIASIVSAIQAETQEVNQAMESGTTQVVETTRLVESTKQSLSIVLEKSQEVNQLMELISQSTVSQASTSQNITDLMKKIAELSANTSRSSTKVAQSIVETAQVAKKLESTVGQFKVAESV
ncbi:MAG: methyl-accepting chemotaxis protein [Cyanobacteria bacterium J06623_7]